MFCTKCGANNYDGSTFCAGCGAQLDGASLPPKVPQAAFAPVALKYAGFWFRTLALIIDSVLCQVLVLIIVYPLGYALGASMVENYSLPEIKATGQVMGFTVGVLIQWLWFTIAESSRWQATVGKKMLGLKVRDENGERISFGKANGRYWSKIISGLIFCIGFVMVALTEKKQGLHDKIAGTLVVRASS